MISRFRAPTAGTRIAVWIFLVKIVWDGVSFLGPDQRLTSPAFTAAKEYWSMEWWGVIFLAVAAIQLVSLQVFGDSRGYVFALCAGMGLYTWWAFLYTVAVFIEPSTPLMAPSWPLLVVACQAAVLATLRPGGNR